MRFRKGSILYIISYILKLILRLLAVPTYFFFPISYLLCVPFFYIAGFEVSCLIFLHYDLSYAGCEEMKDTNLKGHWSLRIIGCNCHVLASTTFFLFHFFYRKVNTSIVVISTFYVFNGAQNAFAGYLAFTKETSKPYHIHPEFVKRVFSIFGVYFLNDQGLGDLGWAKYPASFLPAIVAGYMYFYSTGGGYNYHLDCEIESLSSNSICLQNGECCEVVDARANLFHFIPNLAGSFVAGYGVVRYLTLFVLGCEHDVNQLDGTRSIMEKFHEHQKLLERFDFESPSMPSSMQL